MLENKDFLKAQGISNPFNKASGGRKIYIDVSDLNGFIQKHKRTFA
jgi:hypothetical protein